MSAEIINLRRFKKSKAREQDALAAQENRLAFGRTKAERQLEKARAVQDETRLDGHKIEVLTPPSPKDTA